MTKPPQINPHRARKHYERAQEECKIAASRCAELRPDMTLDALEKSWEGFLTVYVRCQGHLLNAAKNAGASAVQGAIMNEFKKNDKLAYLHQARNEEEHGCEVGRDAIPDFVDVGGVIGLGGKKQKAYFEGVSITHSLPGGGMSFTTLDGSFETSGGRVVRNQLRTGLPITKHEGFLRLRTVRNQGVDYPVPQGLGDPSQHAVVLAEHGLNWLREKLAQVEAILPE